MCQHGDPSPGSHLHLGIQLYFMTSGSTSGFVSGISRRTLLKWVAPTSGSAVLGSCAALERIPAGGRRPTLNLFAVSDRFGTALQQIASQFEATTGIRILVTINSYSELYQRAISDFVGGRAQGICTPWTLSGLGNGQKTTT
ncbi:MAG: hypothetical protein ACUVRV_10115 [Cyanobacteriota bacterium]